MAQINDPVETLSEIRSMMDRSSRFISLSGISGIFVGVFAIAGAVAMWMYGEFYNLSQYNPLAYEVQTEGKAFPWFTVIVALIVLLAAISSAFYFTSRNTKRKKLPLWDNTSKRFLINLFIPLVAGGLFCLILIEKEYLDQIVPVLLLFYGMALLNASKYTLTEIRYLSLIEIGLGVLAAYFTGFGLLFWTVGFGICHIIYGIIMYFKYER